MDKDSLFSIDEISVLEALEIKGGAGSGEPTQNGCNNNCTHNNYPGCGTTNPGNPGNPDESEDTPQVPTITNTHCFA